MPWRSISSSCASTCCRLQRNSRAPVGAVLGLDGREEPTPGGHGAREHLDVIGSEIKRLDEVITGFVRFIRPEELQLVPVNVQLLIAEVIALVEPDARRNGITCRADVPDGLPELRADPALLRQALLNLALNALPGHGRRRQVDDGRDAWRRIAGWR